MAFDCAFVSKTLLFVWIAIEFALLRSNGLDTKFRLYLWLRIIEGTFLIGDLVNLSLCGLYLKASMGFGIVNIFVQGYFTTVGFNLVNGFVLMGCVDVIG